MKKRIYSFLPIFFGLVLFLLHMILFSSPLGSENFPTAVLLFFTGLGSAAVIILPGDKNKFLLYFYFLVSIGFPFILLFFFNFFDSVEHKVLVGLNLVGVTLLKFFVSYCLKSRKDSKE